MAESTIVVTNTAPKFLKGAADQTIRGRFWLAYAQKHGRVKLGDGGRDCSWNVLARQPEIRQYGDSGQQVFAEHDAYEQLTVDIRGYRGTDRLSQKKQLMNKDPLAIVDLMATKLENLTKSISDTFGAELYVDGNASGNENRLLGIKSFMGDDGNTVAADLVANPSDTYAGKSTALANLGGTWSSNLSTSPNATAATDWPEGSGSSEYDYISPKLVNYSSTNWPSGGTTWRENCAPVLRRARNWCHSTAGHDKAPMCHLLSTTLYNEFEDYLETKQRVILPHKESEDLGFPDVINFSGAGVKHEFDCPAGEGFGINIMEMKLFSIHDDLFFSEGPVWDTESGSYLFVVGFFGNMIFNPKHHARYKAYA